jgi:Fic family protein
MVELIKKNINNNSVYYLKHNITKNNKTKSVEKYIGKNIPKNIEYLKIKFLENIYKEKIERIEKLKEEINKRKKKIPKSINIKEKDEKNIRFTYNSNKIEGNTLSIREVKDLYEKNISPNNKDLKDTIETKKHLELINKLLDKKQEINNKNIVKWHKELFIDTKKDIAGKIRNYNVKISLSKFIPPTAIELEYELNDFYKWYNKYKNKLSKILLSCIVHLKFVSIHPFGDGNGRISRLIMNIILNNNNYPIFNIQYKNRKSYYKALENSQIKKNPTYFVKWFINNYIKSLEEEMKK